MSKSIETKVSRTAEAVCFIRAVSFREKNEYYKSEDSIAPSFCPPLLNALAKTKAFRSIFRKHLFGRLGIYEYVVCRTKLIDSVLKDLPASIRQVVIFGAGFDSRAIRFREILSGTTVFELDSPTTQASKIARLREKQLELPDNLKFVALDFDRDSLSEKLRAADFDPGKDSLFILEGLTMFLDPDSAERTFEFIGENSGKNSLVVFDYAVPASGEAPDSKEINDTVAKVGEKYRFTLEKGGASPFLSRFGLALREEFQAEGLKERFCGGEENPSSPAGLFCIALAEKTENRFE